MKSGDAVFLHLAATVTEPVHDLTLVFYDCEEIDAAANGLGRIERELPDWLSADVAILGEPTGGYIEAGCQGTLRVVTQRDRNARAFGASLVGRQRDSQAGRGAGSAGRHTQARTVDIDGCEYREGLSAVRIDGGVAGNVIPDAASVTVNLPLCPRPVAGRGAATRARGVRRARRAHRADRRRGGRAARLVPARRQGAGRGRRRAGPGEIRLDGRGAVRRAGHTGGQFRAR